MSEQLITGYAFTALLLLGSAVVSGYRLSESVEKGSGTEIFHIAAAMCYTGFAAFVLFQLGKAVG